MMSDRWCLSRHADLSRLNNGRRRDTSSGLGTASARLEIPQTALTSADIVAQQVSSQPDTAQLVWRQAGVTLPDEFQQLFTTPDLVFVWEKLHIETVGQTG